MKISQLKISNVSTFPFTKHFGDKQGVKFDAKERNNFNILIGPNGSGKSTFLGIINQIFRVGLIKSYHYNRDIVNQGDIENIKNTIVEYELKPKRFYKHPEGVGLPSRVAISLKLNEYDFENIDFIVENYEIINYIIKKYSNLNIEFSRDEKKHNWLDNELHLELELDTKTGKMNITNTDSLTEGQRQILFYVQQLELIQLCINIYNDHERAPNEKKLRALKNTFAFLKSERPFLYVQDEENPLIIDSIGNRSANIDFNNKHKFNSVSIGYDLFVIKLLKTIRSQFKSQGGELVNTPIKDKIEAIKNTALFQELSGYLLGLLGLQIDINVSLDEIMYFVFINRQGASFTFEKLSSGEKSIIMVLFSLFGYDLSNGLFVIDEPELHLHPYMLKNLIETLKKIGAKLNMQFICATHSPLLIDEQSINSVYKFSIVDGKTVINYPIDGIRADESTLIHILKFENVSKIFFIDKIIMVEGETDEYFWKFFINYMSKQPEYFGKLDNYEILNINGKGSYKKWTRFLNKFGIKGYFIGDRDNTIENGIIESGEMSEYVHLTKSRMKTQHINKGKFYTRIINTIKQYYPNRYRYIVSKIKSFYNSGIFILNRGDLEAYLGLERKGLEPTIHFCNKGFYYWLHDDKMKEFREEFEDIVKQIFL